MPKLEGEPITSATALSRAVGWGELRDKYEVDGFDVYVDDPDEAERLVAANPHLTFASEQPAESSEDLPRGRMTNDGVEYDDEPDTCEHVIQSGENEGDVCGRELPCRFHD